MFLEVNIIGLEGLDEVKVKGIDVGEIKNSYYIRVLVYVIICFYVLILI